MANAGAVSSMDIDGDGLSIARKGPLRCGSCSYEIVSYRKLPACPLCRGFHWEGTRWRPFSRTHPLAHLSRESA